MTYLLKFYKQHQILFNLLFLVASLYLFLFSLELMGTSLKLFGEGFATPPSGIEYVIVNGILTVSNEEIVPDKDNILAAFIYTSMIQLGWSPVVTSLGVDHPYYTFRHRDVVRRYLSMR